MEKETITRISQLRKVGYKLADIIEAGIEYLKSQEEYYEDLAEYYGDRHVLQGHNNSMEELLTYNES